MLELSSKIFVSVVQQDANGKEQQRKLFIQVSFTLFSSFITLTYYFYCGY